MEVYIDADGCPVTEIAVRTCRKFHTVCHLICDTAHEFHLDGADTEIVDQGADSADYALVNRIHNGDLVITQDYGLAAMCLAKGARILHQDGWEYTADNIDALLFSRHESRKLRNSGCRIKGPGKRTQKSNQAFSEAITEILQKAVHG